MMVSSSTELRVCLVLTSLHVFQGVQHLGPATDFYKKLALDCSGQQIGVDLFLLSSQYADLASLCKNTRLSDMIFAPQQQQQQWFLIEAQHYGTKSIKQLLQHYPLMHCWSPRSVVMGTLKRLLIQDYHCCCKPFENSDSIQSARQKITSN